MTTTTNRPTTNRNGTDYPAAMPPEVIDICETYRAARERGDDVPRLRFHWGGVSPVSPEYGPGQDWGDIYDVAGYIGRSMGAGPNPLRVPLLIDNATSSGGGPISAAVVRVRFASRRAGNGRDLWRHPDYLPPNRWDFSPDDLDAHVRDWARHFAANPGDLAGVMLDRLTLSLREAGTRYTLTIHGHDHRGATVRIDRADGGTLALVYPDGGATRYWADNTPEYLPAPGQVTA